MQQQQQRRPISMHHPTSLRGGPVPPPPPRSTISHKSTSSSTSSTGVVSRRKRQPLFQSQPVWFVAMVVTVSVLGYMHRFREAEPELIFQLQKSALEKEKSRHLSATTNMLREKAREEAFPSDANNDKEEKESAQVLQTTRQLLKQIVDEEEEEEGEDSEEEEYDNEDDSEEDEDYNAELELLNYGLTEARDGDFDNVVFQEVEEGDARDGDRHDNKQDNTSPGATTGLDAEPVKLTEREKAAVRQESARQNAGMQQQKETSKQMNRVANDNGERTNDGSNNDSSAKNMAKVEQTKQTRTKDDEVTKADTGKPTKNTATLEDSNQNDTKDKDAKAAVTTDQTTKESSFESTTRDTKLAFKKNVTLADMKERPVHFMKYGRQVSDKDAFSASWLQRTEEFLTMALDKIEICEDAAFQAFRPRYGKLRMTLDWFDFSIEHLSKWWKMLVIFRQPRVYNTAIARFEKYLSASATFPIEKEPALKETIAVIAFQRYKDNEHPDQAFNLTRTSTAVTMESLRRAGLGRVVVVGNGEEDEKVAQATFRFLAKVLDPEAPVSDSTNVNMVGHMEVGYAEFNLEHAKTQNVARNVPRATLFGLKEAFLVAKKKKRQRNQEENKYMELWLGNKHDPAYWKYVYLTEPDSVLQTRPSTLRQLKKEVDKGMVLVPHRLQPIPHEADARGSKRTHLYLPEKDWPVMDLDPIGGNDACCDAFKGPNFKPGLPPSIPSCGNFWYMCDFSRRKPRKERTHDRLKKYSLMRLLGGTEVVTLTSLEHGRPCIPKKNDICVPPDLKRPGRQN